MNLFHISTRKRLHFLIICWFHSNNHDLIINPLNWIMKTIVVQIRRNCCWAYDLSAEKLENPTQQMPWKGVPLTVCLITFMVFGIIDLPTNGREAFDFVAISWEYISDLNIPVCSGQRNKYDKFNKTNLRKFHVQKNEINSYLTFLYVSFKKKKWLNVTSTDSCKPKSTATELYIYKRMKCGALTFRWRNPTACHSK